MAEPSPPQALALATAKALQKALRFNSVAWALAGFALILVMHAPKASAAWAAALSLAAGLAVGYYAARLRLDAAIFARWAQAPDLDAAMRDFDQRLQARLPGRVVVPRPLAERAQGALALVAARRRWLRLQAAAALVAAALSLAPGAG